MDRQACEWVTGKRPWDRLRDKSWGEWWIPQPGSLTFRTTNANLASFGDIEQNTGHYLLVWLDDLIYALPTWVCIVVAFAPAILIALIMHPLSYELDASKNTEKLRSSLAGLVGTAFVFLVSLSTNTLWTDSSQLTGAIGDMAVQEVDLYQSVKQVAPDQAEKLLALIGTHNQLVLDRELSDGALAGNAEIDRTLTEMTRLVDGLPANLQGLDRIKSDFQDFLVSRDEYLSALNFPGLPDVVWFAVVLLGMFFVALLALQRRGRSRRFADVVMVGVVFAIGLIQLPMWTLSSYDMIERMNRPSLTDAALPEGGLGPILTGQVVAVIAIAVVLLLLAAATALWERKDLDIDRDDQEDYDEPATQKEVHDVLVEIRDELREDRDSRPEPPASSKTQGPTASD